MTKEQMELTKAWRTIVAILQQTGYDFMYQEEIAKVADVISKELKMD